MIDDADTLFYWLCFFCKEARKANREAYTPRTICQILAGLLRYMRQEKENPLNSMDTKVFASLHRLLDSLFKALHADGVGAARKQAEVIGFAEEQQLWESGTLTTETPIELFNAVFYYNGLNLILCKGDEHRARKTSQFQIQTMQDLDDSFSLNECLIYTEHRSNNRPGGSKQLDLANKVVKHFSNALLGDRCHIALVEKYLAKLPHGVLEKDCFYCRPKRFLSDDITAEAPWYDNQPVGHNVLKGETLC